MSSPVLHVTLDNFKISWPLAPPCSTWYPSSNPWLCVHFFASKSEVRVVFRETLSPDRTAWQHAEGTQPCSALDNLCSRARRQQSQTQRERERDREASPLAYRSGSSYMRGEFTPQSALLLYVTGSGETDHWQREWPRKRDWLINVRVCHSDSLSA